MRKTSVRELHIHTSELVREAEEGGVILIERRVLHYLPARAVGGNL